MASATLEKPNSELTTFVPHESKRICLSCNRCLPLARFARVRKDEEKRRRHCSECRTAANRRRRTEDDRKQLQDSNREIRKSRITRMAAIVDLLVDRAGGPNAFARRWWELYQDGSESFKRRCLETICAMQLAQDQWKAKERESQIERLRAGEFEEADCSTLANKSDDELLDAMAGALRVLLQHDVLHQVLRRMRECGEIEGDRLRSLRRALQ
jgi:hypothetical protein